MREKSRGIASSGRRPKRSALRAPSPFGAMARCEKMEPFPFPPFTVNAGAAERSKPPHGSRRVLPTSKPCHADRQIPGFPAALPTSTSEIGTQTQPNQGLDLTNPDAAQSVASAPLCLLSGLAAQAHVGRVPRPSATTPRVMETAFPER